MIIQPSFFFATIIVVMCVLFWLAWRPSKTIQFTETMFQCDFRRLPNGLYTKILDEISPRMATYELSRGLGESNHIYLVHHSQLPRDWKGDLAPDFLLEDKKVIA